MDFRIFIDANVILDFLLKRKNYQSAKEVLTLVVNGKIKAYITPSIVHIIGYWLTKAYGSSKAKELILSLLIDVEVVDINHELTLLALHSKMSDIEDALQYYTAIHNKMDYFISSNQAFQQAAIPTLPIYSPEYFINEIYGKGSA